MMKYDEVMDMIMNSARFKMTLNSHKGSIETLDVPQLVKLAKEELDEMMKAWVADDNEKVFVEAGDTMNFIIGVCHKANARYRARK